MHAFSLTSVLLASLQLTRRFSSDDGLFVNQAANWSWSTGLFLGASQLGSGWLYDHFHALGLAATWLEMPGPEESMARDDECHRARPT